MANALATTSFSLKQFMLRLEQFVWFSNLHIWGRCIFGLLFIWIQTSIHVCRYWNVKAELLLLIRRLRAAVWSRCLICIPSAGRVMGDVVHATSSHSDLRHHSPLCCLYVFVTPGSWTQSGMSGIDRWTCYFTSSFIKT